MATGEYWYGLQALDLGLIDKITTSDDHLLSKQEQFDIFTVKLLPKKFLPEKLAEMSQILIDKNLYRRDTELPHFWIFFKKKPILFNHLAKNLPSYAN